MFLAEPREGVHDAERWAAGSDSSGSRPASRMCVAQVATTRTHETIAGFTGARVGGIVTCLPMREIAREDARGPEPDARGEVVARARGSEA